MLTKPQYKFLKKLLKKDLMCGELHENFDPVYVYLLKKDCIEYYNTYKPDDIKEENPTLYCKITEDGKVEFQICKENRYHFWIPTILSIIAIIASFLVVITQNAELWQLVKGLLQ